MKKIIIAVLLLFLCFPFLLRAQAKATSIPKTKQATPKTKQVKNISLTFDADMTSGMLAKLKSGKEKSIYNPEIIKILRQNKVPATIFITGLWAETYPKAVKDMASDSLFEIGDHSYSHRSFTDNCYGLPALPEKEKQADLSKAQEVLRKISGKTPKLFRFPGGCSSANDTKLVSGYNLQVIGWTLASGDAFNSNTKAIVSNVLHNAKDGSIIVFHISGGRYAPKTADVLKVIIPELKKQGFEFKTVSDLAKIPHK